MNPEIENYINAGNDCCFLYQQATSAILDCQSRWKGCGVPDQSLQHQPQKLPFSNGVCHIRQIWHNLLEVDPGAFWNGGQKVSCLRILKPLQRDTEKLRSKLERIASMISQQMKMLTPLLICYSDESFLSSVLSKKEFGYDDLEKDSEEVEREVLKMMASGILDRPEGNSKSLWKKVKTVVMCSVGKINRNKKALEHLRTRLLEIEEQENSADISNAFGSIEDVTAIDKVAIFDGECLGHGEEGTLLLENIVAEADETYSPSHESAGDKEEKLKKNRESNANANEEIFVLHASAQAVDPSFSEPEIQNESMPTSLGYPEDPLTFFKALVIEFRDEVSETIASVRGAERTFYDPPIDMIKYQNGPSLELKYILERVEEAGVGMQDKLARNERKRKNTFSQGQIELMRVLGHVYREAVSCLEAFESFSAMVKAEAENLEEMIADYRQDSTDDEDDDMANKEVKRCPSLDLIFKGGSKVNVA